MWEALAVALLAVLSLVSGLYLGWTARDRVAVKAGDQSLPLREPPLKDPIELEVFRPLMKEEDD